MQWGAAPAAAAPACIGLHPEQCTSEAVSPRSLCLLSSADQTEEVSEAEHSYGKPTHQTPEH